MVVGPTRGKRVKKAADNLPDVLPHAIVLADVADRASNLLATSISPRPELDESLTQLLVNRIAPINCKRSCGDEGKAGLVPDSADISPSLVGKAIVCVPEVRDNRVP